MLFTPTKNYIFSHCSGNGGSTRFAIHLSTSTHVESGDWSCGANGFIVATLLSPGDMSGGQIW